MAITQGIEIEEQKENEKVVATVQASKLRSRGTRIDLGCLPPRPAISQAYCQ